MATEKDVDALIPKTTLPTKLDAVGPKLPAPGTTGPGKVALPTTTPAPKIDPLKAGFAAKVAAQSSLAGRVNASEGAKATRPASLVLGDTSTLLEDALFRCVLYSETSARKTITAAEFAGPKFTRIVLTRSTDQLLALEAETGEKYEYAYCPDSASLSYALKYPEQLWPDWAKMPDPEKKRTIQVDDVTKAVQILVDANSGSKDRRQAYTGALDDLDSLLMPLTRKPYNLILVTLAKVKENPFSGEERIGPDLPPSMLNYVTAEFAAVLYIKTNNYKMLTDRDRFSVEGIDPNTGKTITYTREIFAKAKAPKWAMLKKPPIIAKEEELDLAKFWAKIRSCRKKP